MRTSGVRTLRNQMTKLYLQKKKGASFEELEALTLGGLKAVVEGDVMNGNLMAGQSA